MNNTPNATRKHIALFGRTNSGKSSLLNAIIGQEISIVSELGGTTTDPVIKAMELIPYGPVVFIDTAGLDDDSTLGSLRMERSHKVLQRADYALFVQDIQDPDTALYEATLASFRKYKIPFLMVLNKSDKVDAAAQAEARKRFPGAILVSALLEENLHALKALLIEGLQQEESEPTLVGDLVPYGGKLILVVPIDSEAPKGRIILPQVQLIRDCLDHGIKSYVVRDTELKGALLDLQDINLVVTDSQAFQRVNAWVPAAIPLTSFSILFARQKGDLMTFVEGVHSIEGLKEDSRILISESCTHNHSHEDIGRVKIPGLINRHRSMTFSYEFKMGHDFPEHPEAYDLIIHCGSCMVNRKTMQYRVDLCRERGTALTNYGVVLAYLMGILDRATEMFVPTS